MRKLLLTTLIIIGCLSPSFAQKGAAITESSIVKDTTGTVVPYDIWTRLIITGRYKIKSQKDSPEFVIYRLPDEEYEKVLENLPKPPESKFFRTGGKFVHFKTTDINDNKVNTKNLGGKIIVLNFWFIKCPPCIREMPELNKITETYKSDSSVVFFAIAP